VRRFYNIELDPGFRPVYVGGWIRENGRYGYIHDRMDCFASRAASTNITCSAVGMEDVSWIHISSLQNVLLGQQGKDAGITIEHKKMEVGLLERKKEKYQHLLKLKGLATLSYPPSDLHHQIKELERDIVGFDTSGESLAMPVRDLDVTDIEAEIHRIDAEIQNLRQNQDLKDTDTILYQQQAFNKYHLAWLDRALKKQVLSITHSIALGSTNPLFVFGC
jgi:hypothetical protein